jgi:hypothetical protein
LNQSVVRGPRIFWAAAPTEARTAHERAHLAHELVHVWQYLHLGRTGLELLLHRRYRYRLEAGAPFSSYGYEQQAAIVEDSVRMASGLPVRWALSPAPPVRYAEAIASCVLCRAA